MGTLAEFREGYPQYDDMSDQDLATRLHKKYYSDMSFDEFSEKSAFTPKIEKLELPPEEETAPDFVQPEPAEGIGDRTPIDPVTNQPIGVEPIPTGIPEFDAQEPALPQPSQPPLPPGPRSGEAQAAANEREWSVIGGVIKRIPESAKATGLSGLQAIFESPVGDTLAGLQKGLSMLGGGVAMPGGGSATMEELTQGEPGMARGAEYQEQWKEAQKGMAELRKEATKGNKAAEYAYDVGSVVTDMGFAIGTGLLTGNPGVVIPLMGGQAAAGTYAGRREAGEDPGMAGISSAATGTIEALTEAIPVGWLFARTGALEKILKVTVGEGLQESFSSAFQSAWDKKTIHPDMTFRQAFDSALHEFTLGAGAGATLSTAMATYEAATGEAEKNKAFKALLDDVASTYVADVEEEVAASMEPGAGPGGASVTPEHEAIEDIPLQETGVERLSEAQTDRREQVSINPMDERRSGDRRVDAQLREKVVDMTPEEQYQAIYVDRMTGLHNRRAFEDLPWRHHLASIDVDSLKWVNDTMSPDTGDQMLSEVGKAIDEAIGDSSVVDGYHISGDEYYVQADTKEEADAILDKANEILAGKTLTHEGKGITKEGINITWGTSTHKDLADQLMKDEKKAKEAKGERAGRGETPPGVTMAEPVEVEEVEEKEAPESPQVPVEVEPETIEVEPVETEEKPAEPTEPVVAPAFTQEDLQAKNVPEIRAIQRELGIPAKGKKADAIQSILEETQVETEEKPAEYPELFNVFEQYDNTGEIQIEDLVEEVEQLIDDGNAPSELQQAANAFRKEQEDDFELGGRNDMDQAEENFVSEVQKYLGEKPAEDTEVVESRPAGTVAMQAGNSYVGFINQPYVPTDEMPDLTAPPIRREDVLRPFLKALGINLYEGGIKKGGPLGYYRPKGWETRVKNMSDLEVTAHELAHHIDDKYFKGFERASNRPWIKGPGAQTFAKELKGLSYDETKVYEGFAEFVRHWMTNPAVLTERAPAFLEWFDNYVDNHPLGKNIKESQAGMVAWFNQPRLQQARSKTGRHVLLNGVKDSVWDSFRQSHIDRTHGILLFETDLTGEKAALKGGPTEAARLAASAYSIVDRSLELGYPVVQPDGSFRYEGKGLVEILKPAASETEEWSLYAIGRSANELKGQGRENLFSRGQIDAMMDLETPEFKQIFDEWLEYTNGVVKFAIDMGLLSAEQVEGWRRTQYLPFYRVSRAKNESWTNKLSRKIFGEGSQGVGKRGLPGQVTVVKMLTGGTENIGDIYQNMVMNTSMLIVESIKNDARRHAVDTAMRMTGGRNWITARAKGAKPVSIEREQIADAILKPLGLTYQKYQKALEMGSIDPDTAILLDGIISNLDEYEQFWMRGQAPNDPNVIAVKHSGKTSFYQVNDPILYRSLIAFDPPQKPIINRLMSTVRRLMQGTVTLSLTFMGKNMWRDTQSGFVYTKSGFRPVIDTLRGMKHRIAKDDVYSKAMANGMGMSSYLVDEGTLQRHIQKFHTKKGFTRRYLLDTPANMLYFIENLADAFEMATRLGEFEQAIKRGEHPRHAAYLGREVSTDFARRGDSQITGFLFDAVPFLNAGVQGLDRGYRGLTKDDQRKQVFWRVSTIASMGAILYAIYRDDPCYEELEDWDKDSSWHFWVGGGDCSEKIHGTLTKPWEIGAVASMAERMMEEMIIKPLEGEFPNVPDMGRHVARIFIEQFKMDWVPGMIEPLYEVYAKNENRYFDTPIVSPSMKGEPYTQYRHSTPKVLVEFADMLKEYDSEYQFSPVRAEALIRGYFNSWGAFALMLADKGLYEQEKPAMNWTEYPVIRAWARQGPKRTRYETEYYDLFKEGAELQATINWAVKRGKEENTEVAMEKMEKDNLAMASLIKSNISSSKAAIDMVYNDPDISPVEKRTQIDDLRKELNAMYKEFVTEYRDLVEP